MRRAEQVHHGGLHLRRERVANSTCLKADRRETLEAAQEILNVRPQPARDGYRDAERRVSAPATILDLAKVRRRYVRARREVNQPET
jgi:hypothetical protein